jgi:hypothetical protein
MYRWLVFVHVLGVFLFLMAHGISAGVAFRVRDERNLDRLRALLEFSTASYGIMYAGLMLLLLAGIVTGFMGKWWGTGWIWLAIVLLVLITGAMTGLGSRYYTKLRRAVGSPYMERNKVQPPLPPASSEEIEALLKAGKPMLLTTIGVVGIAVIAWLMMFKPF